jgi:hypothetical protein
MDDATPKRLSGLRVALDVQHLWKPPPRHLDRGAVFQLGGGAHVAEADAALVYAAAAARWLREHGADVLENQPTTGIMVGRYPERNRAAAGWGTHCYLACHLNAGGGHYGAFEHLSATPGDVLAVLLCRAMAAVPEAGPAREVVLHSADRGAICIEACGQLPAVICEPFFGDNPPSQPLLTLGGLVRVGEAIAAGVAAWWETNRPT